MFSAVSILPPDIRFSVFQASLTEKIMTIISRAPRPCRLSAVEGLVILVLAVFPSGANGYSVLTHEAIIDTLWVDAILPVLTKRFPDATEAQFHEAHAYA